MQKISAIIDTQKISHKNIGRINAGDDTVLELEIRMNDEPLQFNNPVFTYIYKKSDGNYGRQERDITIVDGKVVIRLEEQAVTCTGIVSGQLFIVDNGKTSTCIFNFQVGKSFDREIIQSISNVEVLKELDEYVATAFENLTEYEERLNKLASDMYGTNDVINTNEEHRKESEDERKTTFNELVERMSNVINSAIETDEIIGNNETNRINNYNTIKNDLEQVRTSLINLNDSLSLEEQKRVQAEINRVNEAIEIMRKLDTLNTDLTNAETLRVQEWNTVKSENTSLKEALTAINNTANSNEEVRKSNETSRVEAEKIRETEFNNIKEDNIKFKDEINVSINELSKDFDEAVANVTNGSESATNSEIVQARAGEVNLNKRLDKFSASLETKANIKDVNSKIWSMTNMGQDVKEAMTGGSVAVVGKDTILTENIVDNQITPEKTNFIDNTIKFTLERGAITSGRPDNSRPNLRLRCSNMIESESKAYILRKNHDFLIGVVTYDNNVYDGIDLGWLDQDVIEIEKGKGFKFNIRKRSNEEISDEEITVAHEGIEVRHEIIVADKNAVIELTEKVEENSKNIFNASSFIKYTLNSSYFELGTINGGTIFNSNTRIRTNQFLEVSAEDVVKFNLDNSKFKYGISVYDENKNWNGIDYGWLDNTTFKLEKTGYIKLVIKYNDDREITDVNFSEISNNSFSVTSDFKTRIFNELDNINSKLTNNRHADELKSDDFEIGRITGNAPQNSSNRARLKKFIKVEKGDIVQFRKNTNDFKWGISISTLDGSWNGIDYGWLSQSEFVIEEDCLVKVVIRYNDNRDIDETNFNELCQNSFLITKEMNKFILNEIENLKNAINDDIKNIAINSILVEYGRQKGASYVFVRIPKTTNDGRRIVPKVALTSDDGSISGSKCSTLDYAKKHDSIFTVNAGLFDMRKRVPVGQLIIDGVSLINTPMTDDNGVPISDTECYPLAIDKDYNLTTYPRNVDTSTMLNDGIKYAVTAWGKLVDNFKICTDDINAEIVHNGKKYIRQSIGQFQNGDYCICSVDMNRGNVANESGLYYEDLAQIFIDKGVKFAYSLDGGGSTQTVIGKRQLNPIYEGSSGRSVPTVIEFVVE